MEHKISWRALEYKRKEKTADWYWAVILISLTIIVAAFLTHNALFGILIIISTVILMSFSIIAPKTVEITMNQKGIVVGKEMYPFATLESFWVESADEDNQKILLKSKKLIMPLISIPLEQHHHLLVREFLLQYLPEVEMHEPVSQKIMEGLGF
jgi:hypothetical protein